MGMTGDGALECLSGHSFSESSTVGGVESKFRWTSFRRANALPATYEKLKTRSVICYLAEIVCRKDM